MTMHVCMCELRTLVTSAAPSHREDDSRIGCGFLESSRSVTRLMLWNLVKLIGAGVCHAA